MVRTTDEPPGFVKVYQTHLQNSGIVAGQLGWKVWLRPEEDLSIFDYRQFSGLRITGFFFTQMRVINILQPT